MKKLKSILKNYWINKSGVQMKSIVSYVGLTSLFISLALYFLSILNRCIFGKLTSNSRNIYDETGEHSSSFRFHTLSEKNYRISMLRSLFVAFSANNQLIIENIKNAFLSRFSYILILVLALVFSFSVVVLVSAVESDYIGLISNSLPIHLYLQTNEGLLFELMGLTLTGYGIFISIALTLLFFAHRHRTSLSLNYKLITKISNIIHISLVISTIITAQLLILEHGNGNSNSFDNTLSTKIFFWILLLLASLISIAIITINLINSININNMMDDLLEKNRHLVRVLSSATVSNLFTKKIMMELVNNVEQIYQVLIHIVEKNVNTVFQAKYEEWNEILVNNIQGLNKPKYLFVPFVKLQKIDSDGFLNLYRIMLSSHINLISALYKSNNIIEAKKCVESFFMMQLDYNVSGKNMATRYKPYLHELILIIYNSYPFHIRLLLNGVRETLMKDLEGSSKLNIQSICLIYKDLLLRSVEQDDINSVSAIAHSMTDAVEESESSYLEGVIEVLKEIYGVRLDKNKLHNKELRDLYNKAVIFTLFQAILKSIELSNKRCCGFLIKFTITHFHRFEIFPNIFDEFIKSTNKRNPYLDFGDKEPEITVNPHFNKGSLKYCTFKMALLVYGQQKYVDSEKIDVVYSHKPNKLINIKEIMSDCRYKKYLLEKLKNESDEYGLLFLKTKILSPRSV